MTNQWVRALFQLPQSNRVSIGKAVFGRVDLNLISKITR